MQIDWQHFIKIVRLFYKKIDIHLGEDGLFYTPYNGSKEDDIPFIIPPYLLIKFPFGINT